MAIKFLDEVQISGPTRINNIVEATQLKLIDTSGVEYLSATSSGSQNYFYGYQSGNTIHFGQPATYVQNIQVQGKITGDGGEFTGLVTMTDRLDLNDANNNTFIGTNTGLNNTTGSNNTALGYESLNNTTGYNNTALGERSLYTNTTGNHNTALGNRSLFKNTTGDHNTASGYESLFKNTTGYRNTAFGLESLANNTTGYNNTASGDESLLDNTDGNKNVAYGSRSLYQNTSGSHNTASGHESLSKNTSGNYNIAYGYNAGNNTIAGYNVAGNNSIFIGQNTKANANGESNQIVIGDTAIGNGSNTVTIGNSSITDNYFSGNINLADNDKAIFGTGSNLQIYRDANDSRIVDEDSIIIKSQHIAFQAGTSTETIAHFYGDSSVELYYDGVKKFSTTSAGISVTGDALANNFILTSDKRLKENIKQVYNKHINVDWKTFEMKSNKGQRRYGVIAQELEEVHPEFVRTDKEGMKSVAYIDLLIAKIAELEARLDKANI